MIKLNFINIKFKNLKDLIRKIIAKINKRIRYNENTKTV